MTLFKSLFTFANKINNIDALTNPEEFLGPYTDQLLEFWNRLDTLNDEQWEILEGRYRDFCYNQRSKWLKAADEAKKASNETIGRNFANNVANAACDVYGYNAAYYATREIIGGVKNPVFLKMFDDL